MTRSMLVRASAETLGVDPDTATREEITTAYRELAKLHHPDAGGDREKFLGLGVAKDALLHHIGRRAAQSTLPDGRAPCARCGGKGTVESRRAWRTMVVRCPVCKGTGASAPGAL